MVERFFDEPCESVAIDLITAGERIRFSCTYVSNAGNTAERLERMISTCAWLDQCCDTDAPLVSDGDFNLPGVDWTTRLLDSSTTLENVLVQCVLNNNLTQVIQQPTHVSGSLLDFIFVSDPNLIDDISHLPQLFPSDHSPLRFSTDPLAIHLNEAVPRLGFRRMPEAIMADKLDETHWPELFESCRSVDDMYKAFIDRCSSIIESLVPHWKEPSEISNIRRYIRRLEDVQRSDGGGNLALASRLNKAALRLRVLTESRLSIRNARGFYQYANQRLKSAQGIPTLHHNGEDITHDHQKAELLGRLFASVFDTGIRTGSHSDLTPTKRVDTEDRELIIDEHDVYFELSRLKPKQSVTADEIPPIFLKTFAIFLCEPLFLIFKQSYAKGAIPELFRRGIVTPVYKKGLRSAPANYRPITQGSVVCSILEKLLTRHISNYIASNRLFHPSQHGFVA